MYLSIYTIVGIVQVSHDKLKAKTLLIFSADIFLIILINSAYFYKKRFVHVEIFLSFCLENEYC